MKLMPTETCEFQTHTYPGTKLCGKNQCLALLCAPGGSLSAWFSGVALLAGSDLRVQRRRACNGGALQLCLAEGREEDGAGGRALWCHVGRGEAGGGSCKGCVTLGSGRVRGAVGLGQVRDCDGTPKAGLAGSSFSQWQAPVPTAVVRAHLPQALSTGSPCF